MTTMLHSERDRTHRLWIGGTMDVGGVTVREEFRYAQGLLPADAAALAGRPDLCARLHGMALWSAAPEDLDAAVAGLLGEDKPSAV